MLWSVLHQDPKGPPSNMRSHASPVSAAGSPRSGGGCCGSPVLVVCSDRSEPPSDSRKLGVSSSFLLSKNPIFPPLPFAGKLLNKDTPPLVLQSLAGFGPELLLIPLMFCNWFKPVEQRSWEKAT